MIISIASGKGGTGKTTVATNLAVSVSGPVQLLDCDVEEPNAHLFLRPSIQETKPSPHRFLKLTWKNVTNAKSVRKYAGSGPLPFSAIRCSRFPSFATAVADAWRYARRGHHRDRTGTGRAGSRCHERCLFCPWAAAGGGSHVSAADPGGSRPHLGRRPDADRRPAGHLMPGDRRHEGHGLRSAGHRTDPLWPA
jgi:hypothetical protein